MFRSFGPIKVRIKSVSLCYTPQNRIRSIVLNGIFYNKTCLHPYLFHKLCMRYLLVSFVHFSWPIVLIALLSFHAVFPDIQDYDKKPSSCHLQMFLCER